jgi:phage protein D
MPTLSPDARQHATDTAESVRITVNGATLGEEWLGMLLDVHVRDNLLLPDFAVVRFRDPHGEQVDSSPLKLGASLKVAFGAARERSPTEVFSGEVVALEPEWRDDGVIIAARAFDKGHRLNRKKQSFTYVQMKASDIVRRVASRAGLAAGQIDSTTVVHDHMQQSQETDWDFCWRLARMNGFEFGVWDDKVVFRKRDRASAAATLAWGENLHSFRPRASVVGQVTQVTVSSHDPKARQPTTGVATSTPGASSAPISAKRNKAIGDLSGGEALVADRVATSSDEAHAMAQASLRRNASTFLEADGVAHGSPKIVAGATVAIANVGKEFGGDYLVSSSTHVYKGGTGYTTRFEITGDRSRAFADLVAGGASPASGGGGGGGGASWANSLVIAVVTNNKDPEDMGRVKVEYPALGRDMESDWARVATLNAGKQRGIFFTPQVNDEVVVGFEHGDARRPFVLGSLFTGKEKLDAELKDPETARDALFGVKTPHQVAMHAAKELKLTSDEKMTLTVTGNKTGAFALTADGDITSDSKKNVKATAAQNIELAANSTVKVSGKGTVEIESSGQVKVKGSAAVSIESSGVVEVKGSMVKLG